MKATGFRYYFTPLVGVLFTFPSRYWYAIGLSGVFSLAGWSRRIRAELLVLRVTQDTTRLRLASSTGLSPSMVELSRTFHSRFGYHSVVLLPRRRIATTTVWALPRSLATTEGIDFSFSSWRYLDVSVLSVPYITLWIHVMLVEVFSTGFPHSDIHGSRDICSSPWLFAAYHVLHRLLVPRHPPCALSSLT